MRSSSWTPALIATFLCQALAWNHISERQLQDALDASGYTLVSFVNPTDPSSLALEPEYLTLQTSSPPDPNIVTFDCHAHPLACTHLDVPHPSSHPAPTIRIYHRDGRVDTHRGAHTARSILHFLHRTLRPTVLDLSIPLHPSMQTMDDVVYLAHVHPDDGELYSAFYAVAGEYRDRYSFVVVPPEEGARGSVVRCVRNRDEGGAEGEGAQREGVMRGEGEVEGDVDVDVEGVLRGFVERGCSGEGVEVVKARGGEVEKDGEGERVHEEL